MACDLAQQAGLDGGRGLEPVEEVADAGVAVDRDELALPCEVCGEPRRVAAGAEGAVDGDLAGGRRQQGDQLGGEVIFPICSIVRSSRIRRETTCDGQKSSSRPS